MGLRFSPLIVDFLCAIRAYVLYVLCMLGVLLRVCWHVSMQTSQPEPYTRPTVLPLGAGRIELLAARHPCLEAQDAVAFIANDVQMKAGESALQIVTGPNMGGARKRPLDLTFSFLFLFCFYLRLLIMTFAPLSLTPTTRPHIPLLFRSHSQASRPTFARSASCA